MYPKYCIVLLQKKNKKRITKKKLVLKFLNSLLMRCVIMKGNTLIDLFGFFRWHSAEHLSGDAFTKTQFSIDESKKKRNC